MGGLKKIILIGFFLTWNQAFAADQSLSYDSYRDSAKKVSEDTWVRLKNPVERLSVDVSQRYVSFVEKSPRSEGTKKDHLKVLDIVTKGIHTVSTDYKVAKGAFWAPGGSRLMYIRSAMTGTGTQGKQDIKTEIMVFEAKNSLNHIVDSFDHVVGHLNFDPRDYRLLILHANGIHQKKLKFPTERMASWQYRNTQKDGRYLSSDRGIYWLSNNGITMKPIRELLRKTKARIPENYIQHFDISPDGRSIVWSEANDGLFTSRDGSKAVMLDYGKDPSWHPTKPMVLFAGARRVGNKTISYDLKVVNLSGKKKWLTSTQFSKERWPRFIGKKRKQIVYTKEKATDIYIHSSHLF